MKERKEMDLMLRERWSGDLIIRIVIALNEALPLEPVLRDVKVPSGLELSGTEPDLRGIDLSHQNLRGPWQTTPAGRTRTGVDLSGEDLSGADLSWALLPRADLRGTRLTGADLSHAELIMADLRGADLTGAVLKEAWLLDTKFQGAKIEAAQLEERRKLGQLDFDYHAFEI